MSKTFKKFHSIKNHYDQKNINRWLSLFPEAATVPFVVTEKLDGANFQIILTQDKEVQFASRNRILGPDSDFYGWQEVLKGYQTEIDLIQKSLYAFPRTKCLRIYGELYGDGIQKRIQYGPKQFKAFSIYRDDLKMAALDARDSLHNLGINMERFWVPIHSYTVNLEEALSGSAGPNEEGIVIEPSRHVFSRGDGDPNAPTAATDLSYMVIKKKTKEFCDKMNVKHKEPKAAFVGSEAYQVARDAYMGLLNANRCQDMFGKEGPMTGMSDMGKYIKLVTEDAKADFLEEHGKGFKELLTDEERSQVFRGAGAVLSTILRESLRV